MTLSGTERTWRKSSYSGGGNDCVEISTVDVGTAVRDSKNPNGPHLSFGSAGWATFLGRARAGLSSH